MKTLSRSCSLRLCTFHGGVAGASSRVAHFVNALSCDANLSLRCPTDARAARRPNVHHLLDACANYHSDIRTANILLAHCFGWTSSQTCSKISGPAAVQLATRSQSPALAYYIICIVLMPLNRVCVFCGSSPGSRPVYMNAAASLGKELAARNLSLVYGGA